MRTLSIVLLCTGCSDPFSIDRHDLLAARIIGVRKSSEGYVAQVWNGTSTWHVSEPMIHWFDSAGEPLGEGSFLPNQDAQPTSLSYQDLTNTVHQAEFDLQEQDAFFPISLQEVAESESYLLEDRQEKQGANIDDGIARTQTRLVADVDDKQQMRWMTTQGIGSFLELDRSTADFYWKELVLEREDIVIDQDIADTYTTVFALSIDQEGRNQWQWVDLWRESPTRLVRHRNRYFPIDISVDVETDILVTIASNDSLFGFSFLDPELVSSDTELPTPLDCALNDDAFLWWWVETGICTQSDLDGQRIRLRVSP